MLTRVIVATLTMHVAVVTASLAVPVLASLIAAAADVPPYLVGFYSAVLSGVAAFTSLVTPGLVRRFGAIRLHQIVLGLTAIALAALVPARASGLGASALLLGIAYGPVNPAGTIMLVRFTPPAMRARIFSLKQTAVPIAGALAGIVLPRLALAVGWRAAVLALAACILMLVAIVEPWRVQLDAGGDQPSVVAGFRWWSPLHLFATIPSLRPVGIATLAFGSIQFTFTAVFATVLVHSGWSLAGAGTVLSAAMGASVCSRFLWGWVADRLTPRVVLLIMGAMMSVACLASCFLTSAWWGVTVVALAVLFGLSASGWNGIAVADAVRLVPSSVISEASAGLYCLTFCGALAGPAVFSVIVLATGSPAIAFLVLAATGTIGTLLLLR